MKWNDQGRTVVSHACKSTTAAALASLLIAASASGQTVERISLTDTGAQPDCPAVDGVVPDDGNYETNNECNRHPMLSSDDRYIVFVSEAPLVAADTNGVADVYLHDRNDDSLELISVNSDETIANGPSSYPAVASTAGGAVVAFLSRATNLDSELSDENGFQDIFVRDTAAGTTIRIRGNNEPNDETCEEEISAKPSLDKCRPSLDASGELIAFVSTATNFGVASNPGLNVFLYDLISGDIELLSVDHTGQPATSGISHSPDFSNDGKFVAFTSTSNDLVDPPAPANSNAFRRELATDTTILLSLNSEGEHLDRASSAPLLTSDGELAAFMTSAQNIDMLDNDTRSDIFLRDPQTPSTLRVSLTNAGEANSTVDRIGSISNDGGTVAWWTDTINGGEVGGIGHVVARDRNAAKTILVTAGANGNSWDPEISSDGQFVVFTSMADNFGVTDTGETGDIYLLPVDVVVTSDGVDLAIVIDNEARLFAGEEVTYSVTVTNAGPDDAIGAAVTANFPAPLDDVSWSCASQSGGSCASASGTGDIDTTVDLQAAGSVLFTVTATVAGSGGEQVTVSASVSAPGGTTELDPNNNTDSDVEQVFDEDLIFRSGFETGE